MRDISYVGIGGEGRGEATTVKANVVLREQNIDEEGGNDYAMSSKYQGSQVASEKISKVIHGHGHDIINESKVIVNSIQVAQMSPRQQILLMLCNKANIVCIKYRF